MSPEWTKGWAFALPLNHKLFTMKLFNRNNKEKLLQFNIGDKVDIHNILTSEWVYTGTISSISNDVKKDSNGYYSRMATIICNDGTIRENAMGTATKVN